MPGRDAVVAAANKILDKDKMKISRLLLVQAKAYEQALVKMVTSGEKVIIQGLGTFYRKDYKSATRRNPRTGESVKTKPSSKLRFHPCLATSNLKVSASVKKEAVSEKTEDSPAKKPEPKKT
jgi:nucleoid DNA-binding protein